MSLVIWTQSHFATAFLLFVIDIPALWAIHRGLCALQGYYLYRKARDGSYVPIARSRLPIFSGHLLRGASRLPSLVLILNAAAYLVLLFALLSIRSESRSSYRKLSLTRVTSLVGAGRSQAVRPSPSFCAERSPSTVDYWPAAFNETDGRTSAGVCQSEAPGIEPIFRAECIAPKGQPCYVDEYQSNPITFGIVASRSVTPRELQFASSESKDAMFRGKEGHAFLITSPEKPFLVAVMLMRDPTKKQLLLGFQAQPSYALDRNRIVFSAPPLLISPYESSSPLLEALRNYSSYEDLGFYEKTTPQFLENVLRRHLRGVPSKGAYSRSTEQVTVMTTTAIVLHSVLAVCGVMLVFVKEILAYFLQRKEHGMFSELHAAYDVDVLSRSLRREMELVQGLHPSGDFAVLGTRIDDDGVYRVVPVVPVSMMPSYSFREEVDD